MRISAPHARRTRLLLAALALLLAAAACGTDPEKPEPQPEKGLPEAAAGRLVRILGDGSATALANAGSAGSSPVVAPMGLTVSEDGDLLGWQSGFTAASQLFRLDPKGTATPVPDLGDTLVRVGPGPGWSLSTAELGKVLLVVHRNLDLETVDRASGDRVGLVKLPRTDPQAWAAGLLPAFGQGSGTAVLQYGDHWYSVSADDPARPRLTPVAAPVPGAVVAAPADDGTRVLTRSALVTLDADGTAAAPVPYTLPSSTRGSILTSAAAAPDGGVVATLTSPPNGGGGTVVHIAADGKVDVLARGRAPATPGSDCDDADTPALEAHLTLPMSVAVWEDRVVVADVACNSVLQLPLP